MDKEKITENIDTAVEETTETAEEMNPAVSVEQKPTPKQTKITKHELAKAKISQSQSALSDADAEIEECMKKVEEDLEQFKQAEAELVSNGLRPARETLKDLGVTEKLIDSLPSPKVDLNDPELKPVEIKKISSGKLSGFTWGLIGGAVALGIWCYTAIQSLGLPLLPSKFPDMERLNAALAWTAKQLGQGENIAVGGAIVGVGVVVLIGLIYWIVTALRGSSNLKVAEKIEADTEFYCTKKEECKEQMKKVREHIANAQKTVEKYEVLLGELNGTLRRARFIEETDVYDQMHSKTKNTVATLQSLADKVEKFLDTPMAEHGILSKDGIDILEAANKAANDYVMELYK